VIGRKTRSQPACGFSGNAATGNEGALPLGAVKKKSGVSFSALSGHFPRTGQPGLVPPQPPQGLRPSGWLDGDIRGTRTVSGCSKGRGATGPKELGNSAQGGPQEIRPLAKGNRHFQPGEISGEVLFGVPLHRGGRAKGTLIIGGHDGRCGFTPCVGRWAAGPRGVLPSSAIPLDTRIFQCGWHFPATVRRMPGRRL